MKILVASALFPPDIAEPAPYIKELTAKLANENIVTVLTYGKLPEEVTSVKIHPVPKSLPGPLRLIAFTYKLISFGFHNDVIITNNAPSTELPLIVASVFLKKKLFLLMSDKKINYLGWRKTIHDKASSAAHRVLSLNLPPSKPERHPFLETTSDRIFEYTKSWESHVDELIKTLKHD